MLLQIYIRCFFDHTRGKTFIVGSHFERNFRRINPYVKYFINKVIEGTSLPTLLDA
jgi:hypothetical protein